MTKKKELVVISNENIFSENNNFYCENLDIKSTTEGLEKENFNVSMISRKSKERKFNAIHLNKIYISPNIFRFLINVFKTFKNNETKYLLMSITPFTFLASFFLFLFRKKSYVYLRSDGYEEYKAILGFFGTAIYHFMYLLATSWSTIIVCQEKLANNKESKLVLPSQLDHYWFENYRNPKLDKARLLYVGRIKIEKGIFSLLDIFSKFDNNTELSIVGSSNNLKKDYKGVNFIGYINDTNQLIKIHDNHNIFILPSYTEAHPQVLYESLARLRPVIIFEEITHVTKNYQGIFISKRNSQSLLNTIKFIMENYSNIQNSIKKNTLPKKSEFINQMSKILY